MQTVIAILLVLACVAYVGWQLLRTIRSGNGKAGACCSKGCGSDVVAPVSDKPREQFVASDLLRRKRV